MVPLRMWWSGKLSDQRYCSSSRECHSTSNNSDTQWYHAHDTTKSELRRDSFFSICCPLRISLLWLLLPVVYRRGVVIELLQFHNQMLLLSRQLASKGIIDQLQKNHVEMKHREKRWQRAEEQFMIRKERRQSRKTDLKQNIFSFPFIFDLNEIDLSYCCASGIWNCSLSNHFIQLCTGSYVSFPPSLNFCQEKPMVSVAAGQWLLQIFLCIRAAKNNCSSSQCVAYKSYFNFLIFQEFIYKLD